MITASCGNGVFNLMKKKKNHTVFQSDYDLAKAAVSGGGKRDLNSLPRN